MGEIFSVDLNKRALRTSPSALCRPAVSDFAVINVRRGRPT